MQTPKEYAEELVLEMYNAQDDGLRWMPDAINCAKVAVRKILKEVPMHVGNLNPKWKFFTEVLNELNKMQP